MASFKLSGYGHEIFMDKYAYPGETKWKQLAKRVSKAVALPEKEDVREQTEKKFFEAINSADFCL